MELSALDTGTVEGNFDKADKIDPALEFGTWRFSTRPARFTPTFRFLLRLTSTTDLKLYLIKSF